MAFNNDFIGDAEDRDRPVPNRSQVRGRDEVKVLATGISASLCSLFHRELSLLP